MKYLSHLFKYQGKVLVFRKSQDNIALLHNATQNYQSDRKSVV